ncbi:hypothetical protein IIF7_13290 [Zunongwangia atlantica 22II14-10F7]|uniref:Lipoprotein n=2 Tax=Zunongwangia TaxID=417127 RepID=A0A1Y1T243_9FLAO|nr:hypothetical protein IIF7_13290 [Zunongwangia atlantica 22II14-10F7]
MVNMKCLISLFIICFFLISCGDSDSKYITSITNNTDYKIIVQIFQDTTIICESFQETIIEDNWGRSVKEMNCAVPDIFLNGDAEIIIDDGNKILTKNIIDDKNWICIGEEDWSLIMVGSFYNEIKTTFIVNQEDITKAK